MKRTVSGWVGLVVAASVSVAGAQAPPALPMGAPQSGTAGDNKPAEYTVIAKTAGVLTVAAKGSGDLTIQVLDGDGQIVPNGSIDRDLNGDEGSEFGSVQLPESGTYRVRVRVQGGSSTFQVSGSFVSFPAFEMAGDADRRPASAKVVQVGRAYDDTLDPGKGDNVDWFVFKATEAGTLTVLTRPAGGGPNDAPDLVLEAYAGGNFSDSVQRSDQDLQGNSANESVSVTVTAGQSVHVRVTNAFSSRSAAYRLSSSLAP